MPGSGKNFLLLLLYKFFLCLLLIVEAGPCLAQNGGFYDTSSIQKIELQFTSPKWDYMLDTAKLGKGGYVMAQWVKINGQIFDSVGVKYKGSSSYDSTFLKNPIHIELDAYKEQDYQGYVDIKLNNNYADPSMTREVLAYSIARSYMEAPQANFAKVYINGRYMGVYTNAESVNKSYLNRRFRENNGVFVKCNPNLTPSPGVKSNLRYITNDTSSYYNYYELKSDYGWTHLKALCDTVTNNATKLQTSINVDRALWMLAFNNVLVNLDSYSGVFAQNYYLYRDAGGRFNPIVWDLNMSFAGFPFLGNSNSSLGSLSLGSSQTMPLHVHATDSYWPLINAIYNNARYRRMYTAHVKTLLAEQIASGSYSLAYTAFKNRIDTSVQSDQTKFFTYTQFQNALTNNHSVGSYSVPGIQTLMNGRMAYYNSVNELTVSAIAFPTVAHSVNAAKTSLSIRATITSASAATVLAGYRYQYTQSFSLTTLFDDGLHGDGAAADNVFAADVPLAGNHLQYYTYAENASNTGVFSPARAEHEFHEFNLMERARPGDIVINEFLAENTSDVKNEFHLHEDWIELYNQTNKPLSLSGMYLSDDTRNWPTYAFPSTATIAPGGYVTLWADNILSAQAKQLHCNFKLNNAGGALILSNGAYQAFDAFAYGNQIKDKSMARCPDGYGRFTEAKYPTFGFSNCVVGLDENENKFTVKVYPNPASNQVKITVANANSLVWLTVSDISGRRMHTEQIGGEYVLDVSAWHNGIYLVTVHGQACKLIVNKHF